MLSASVKQILSGSRSNAGAKQEYNGGNVAQRESGKSRSRELKIKSWERSMSRSRAMRQVRQAIQRHVAGSPASGGRMNRRDLLKAAGFTLGAAFLGSRVRAASGASAVPRIGIVGAGMEASLRP